MHTASGSLINDPVSNFTAYFDDDNSEAWATTPPSCSPGAMPHQALYALQSLAVSRQSFYLDLRACAVASRLILLRFNKGTWTVALWSALQILWYYQDLVDSGVKLHMADNTPHTHKALGIFVSLLLPQWVTLRSNAIGHPPCPPPSCLHMPLVLGSAAVVILCTMTSRALAARSHFTIGYVDCRTSHCPCPYAMASFLRRPSLPLLMLNVLLPFLVPSFTLFYTPMQGRGRFTILHCLKQGRALMVSLKLWRAAIVCATAYPVRRLSTWMNQPMYAWTLNVPALRRALPRNQTAIACPELGSCPEIVRLF
jgi:hypothetical protein